MQRDRTGSKEYTDRRNVRFCIGKSVPKLELLGFLWRINLNEVAMCNLSNLQLDRSAFLVGRSFTMNCADCSGIS